MTSVPLSPCVVGAAAALCFVSLALGVRVRQDVVVTGVLDLR